MNKDIIVLLSMIFLHILDDFHLQGILTNLKQAKWWRENYPDEKYKNDYIISLFIHSFSWTFMIFIPIFISMYGNINNINTYLLVLVFGVNIVVHTIVDDAKANALAINLITDQILHLFQIVVTWLIFICR